MTLNNYVYRGKADILTKITVNREEIENLTSFENLDSMGILNFVCVWGGGDGWGSLDKSVQPYN